MGYKKPLLQTTKQGIKNKIMKHNIFIHQTAEVSPRSELGDGTKVWNHAQIRENAKIGKNCIISKNVYIDFEVQIGNGVKIQNNVSVYNGVTIKDEVFVGPMVVFTNDLYPRAFNSEWKVTNTLIDEGASLGANCVIVCGNVVGKYAMVAAGAVVTKNVPNHAIVAGNPARIVGYVYKDGTRVPPEHFNDERTKIINPNSGESFLTN